MFDYNLLPEKYKIKTQRWIIIRQLNLGFILLNTALIGLSLFISAIFYSYNYMVTANQFFDAAVNQKSSQNAPQKIFEQNLRALKLIQDKHFSILDFFSTTMPLFSVDTKIHEFNMDFNGGELLIEGIAPDRSSLQSMEDNLNRSGYKFEKLPLEAYTQEQNIPFSFNLNEIFVSQ